MQQVGQSDKHKLAQAHAAALDQRAKNARFRQNQLLRLHSSLLARRGELHDTIVRETGCSELEAKVEILLTTSAVAELYESLDVEGELQEEYRLSTQKNNLRRRDGVGLVLLRPTSHTRLYSTIQPLAVAIRAGSCVVIELPHTLLELDPLLRAIVSDSLDHEAYCVIESLVTDSAASENCLVIDQESTGNNRSHCLLSSPYEKVVAVVDRSADVNIAAREIVRALRAFKGKSPYAPDLVLVNEFLKEAFLHAVAAATAQLSATRGKSIPSSQAVPLRLTKAEDAGECSCKDLPVLVIADFHDRSSPALLDKNSGPNLVIVAVRSLTDATIFLSQFPTLLAAYHFCQPSVAKFLSQQINSRVSFINHIPLNVLVGPAAPLHHPFPPSMRYVPSMMSISHVEIIDPRVNAKYSLIQSAIESGDAKVLEQGLTPLKPTGQPSGTSFGFFDQGILTGAIFLVLPAIASFSFLSYVAACHLCRLFLSLY